MKLNTETEEKIIISAEKLFYQKGKAGTSMQDIADDAGINRTLLNYYFRSKDQLFEAVFRKALGSFVPTLAALLHSDISFEEYVPKMIHMIIDNMLANPQIPIFILQELSSNPERMPQIIKEMGIDPILAYEKMYEKMEAMPDRGKELHSDFSQMIMNLISLCIFPFAARPVITGILFNGDDDAFIAAMNERKKVLPQMFQNLMSKNQ
ncbi:MAG: TetR/AcrR family transcriptional regulator [Bacteroidetes bacterium]|nr:TetR/AcrR family transcriptional regulator [Bacteroidota bacterium]